MLKGLAACGGAGVAGYLAYAGTRWCLYLRVKRDETDPLLDRFMPASDAAEFHHVPVAAPTAVTYWAAANLDLMQSAVIRAVFKGRAWILRAKPNDFAGPRSLLDQMKALGWCVLAEIPGREIVMGAATQPWVADTVFRPTPADRFAAFHESGYVKIVWTIRADPSGGSASIASTETRVVTTDPAAREKFRWYWSCFSPGIVLIRKIALRMVKKEAERRARRPVT